MLSLLLFRKLKFGNKSIGGFFSFKNGIIWQFKIIFFNFENVVNIFEVSNSFLY